MCQQYQEAVARELAALDAVEVEEMEEGGAAPIVESATEVMGSRSQS